MPAATLLSRAQPLPRTFYADSALRVARAVLGMVVVHKVAGSVRAGVIVETEAYLDGRDLASHAAKGRTARTEVMFGPPGHAYVYLIYGMHHCLNVVTEQEGHASAVLVRALEPVRNLDGKTSGPGLLCKALGVDRRSNGLDLLGDRLYVTIPSAPETFSIVKRPRIGVDYAGSWARRLLRFYIRGNTHVSRL